MSLDVVGCVPTLTFSNRNTKMSRKSLQIWQKNWMHFLMLSGLIRRQAAAEFMTVWKALLSKSHLWIISQMFVNCHPFRAMDVLCGKLDDKLQRRASARLAALGNDFQEVVDTLKSITDMMALFVVCLTAHESICQY